MGLPEKENKNRFVGGLGASRIGSRRDQISGGAWRERL